MLNFENFHNMLERKVKFALFHEIMEIVVVFYFNSAQFVHRFIVKSSFKYNENDYVLSSPKNKQKKRYFLGHRFLLQHFSVLIAPFAVAHELWMLHFYIHFVHLYNLFF